MLNLESILTIAETKEIGSFYTVVKSLVFCNGVINDFFYKLLKKLNFIKCVIGFNMYSENCIITFEEIPSIPGYALILKYFIKTITSH